MISHQVLKSMFIYIISFHSCSAFQKLNSKIHCCKRFSYNFYLSNNLLSVSSQTGNSFTKLSAKKKDIPEVGKYSKTVLLPVTSFDQRANSLKKEPEIQKWWNDNSIYENLSQSNQGDKFILHDGPPYANGNLHIGHALNKILKDFINKYQVLKGKKVRFIPGWDCHGLPIELKVLQSMKINEREKLTPIDLRKKAAEFAIGTVESQMESFKRYGIWGDWSKPYLTLQPEYEGKILFYVYSFKISNLAEQIKVFGQMVTKGHIYRGKKPVHWSPSSRTALAEAELEYPENHISKSIYVGFKVTKQSDHLISITNDINADIRVAIWYHYIIPIKIIVIFINMNIHEGQQHRGLFQLI